MLSLLFLLACAGEPAPGAAAAGPPPALVTVAEVRSGALSDAWSAMGEVKPLNTAQLAAGASGPVRAVLVREGDSVTQGALLLELDMDLARAQLDAAVASADAADLALREARARLVRTGQLQPGVLAPADVEALQAEVDGLDAQARALRAKARESQALLERHRLRAPFAGVVSERLVDPGEWVSPGQAVLQLVSSADLELRARVGLDLVELLRPGQQISATGRGALGAPVQVPAEVLAVVPALDGDSRTALVRARPSDPSAFTPGASVAMRFPVTLQAEQALLLPRDALLLGPGEARVMRVTEGKAEAVTVRVLASGQDEVLIAPEGLSLGDVVVVRGNERLRPGQAVQLAPSAAESAAPKGAP